MSPGKQFIQFTVKETRFGGRSETTSCDGLNVTGIKLLRFGSRCGNVVTKLALLVNRL